MDTSKMKEAKGTVLGRDMDTPKMKEVKRTVLGRDIDAKHNFYLIVIAESCKYSDFFRCFRSFDFEIVWCYKLSPGKYMWFIERTYVGRTMVGMDECFDRVLTLNSSLVVCGLDMYMRWEYLPNTYSLSKIYETRAWVPFHMRLEQDNCILACDMDPNSTDCRDRLEIIWVDPNGWDYVDDKTREAIKDAPSVIVSVHNAVVVPPSQDHPHYYRSGNMTKVRDEDGEVICRYCVVPNEDIGIAFTDWSLPPRERALKKNAKERFCEIKYNLKRVETEMEEARKELEKLSTI